MKDPWRQIALKRCIMIEIRRNRNDASSVAAVKRSFNLERNLSPLKLIGPSASMASGTKARDCANFRNAAHSTTLPAAVLVEAR